MGRGPGDGRARAPDGAPWTAFQPAPGLAQPQRRLRGIGQRHAPTGWRGLRRRRLGTAPAAAAAVLGGARRRPRLAVQQRRRQGQAREGEEHDGEQQRGGNAVGQDAKLAEPHQHCGGHRRGERDRRDAQPEVGLALAWGPGEDHERSE
jgi:hypothetical protein